MDLVFFSLISTSNIGSIGKEASWIFYFLFMNLFWSCDLCYRFNRLACVNSSRVFILLFFNTLTLFELFFTLKKILYDPQCTLVNSIMLLWELYCTTFMHTLYSFVILHSRLHTCYCTRA